jgi:hypothetical protein
MTYILKSRLIAAALASACVPAVALAQSSTSPGTTTTTPSADCSDVAGDPNCKPNQNQKEPSDNSTNLNPEGELNNPSLQTQDPAVSNNKQTPGSPGSPENASGGNSVSPSGSGNVEGDNAGGAGAAGSSSINE